VDRLKEKVALVFGSGPGVGGTVAHFLAREGAQVAVLDAEGPQLDKTVSFLNERGYRPLAVPCNVFLEDEIARAIDVAAKHFGGVDVAVDTVSILRTGSLEELTIDTWYRQIDEMLTPGMLAMKYSLRAMVQAKRHGSMINVIPADAYWGHPGRLGLSAMKAALMNLVRVAAMEVAHLHVRVNAITPINLEDEVATFASQPDETSPPRYSFDPQDALRTIPIGRLPTASDIAWMAVFLASDESSFITGADFPVDGGVRAKYPMWSPGALTQATLAEVINSSPPNEFGEPISKR
jgi:NAD(P)-dependent dehydrogenase (short-subunit alcohol dehydrogenase family)